MGNPEASVGNGSVGNPDGSDGNPVGSEGNPVGSEGNPGRVGNPPMIPGKFGKFCKRVFPIPGKLKAVAPIVDKNCCDILFAMTLYKTWPIGSA